MEMHPTKTGTNNSASSVFDKLLFEAANTPKRSGAATVVSVDDMTSSEKCRAVAGFVQRATSSPGEFSRDQLGLVRNAVATGLVVVGCQVRGCKVAVVAPSAFILSKPDADSIYEYFRADNVNNASLFCAATTKMEAGKNKDHYALNMTPAVQALKLANKSPDLDDKEKTMVSASFLSFVMPGQNSFLAECRHPAQSRELEEGVTAARATVSAGAGLFKGRVGDDYQSLMTLATEPYAFDGSVPTTDQIRLAYRHQDPASRERIFNHITNSEFNTRKQPRNETYIAEERNARAAAYLRLATSVISDNNFPAPGTDACKRACESLLFARDEFKATDAHTPFSAFKMDGVAAIRELKANSVFGYGAMQSRPLLTRVVGLVVSGKQKELDAINGDAVEYLRGPAFSKRPPSMPAAAPSLCC